MSPFGVQVGEHAEAGKWLTRFLSVRENSSVAHRLRGDCWERQNMLDKALQAYR